MRRLNLYIIYIIIGFLMISCSKDFLDKKPYDTKDEERLFKTPDNFESAMRGVYAGFVDIETDNLGVYYGGSMYIVPDLLSDNLIISQEGRRTFRNLYEFSYNSNNYDGFEMFGDAYKIIRKSNAIINNIGNIDKGDFRDNILGQALTARALAHFDLVRFYAQIPTQSKEANNSLGVAYVKVVDPNIKPPRLTVKEVYTEVLKDLNRASSLIGNNSVESGMFNKNTVNTLLSRIYLYMGDWQKCITFANKVSGNVCPRNKFAGIWKDENVDGVLTQFLISQDNDVHIGNEYSQTSPSEGVKSEYVVAYDFYNMFKDEDIRKSTYIQTSDFGGVSYNHVAKYFGKTGQVNNIVNSKVLRMAEVMLNKAEAYAEIGDEANALSALDQVRANRYSNFVSSNEKGQALKDAISRERRLEFAFEMHRFFDLKRKGKSIERDPDHGDKADGSGIKPVVAHVPAGDYKFQLPIPLDAMHANKNLKQNLGY